MFTVKRSWRSTQHFFQTQDQTWSKSLCNNAHNWLWGLQMHLKEALNVFIYGRFWVFGSVSAFFITAAARFKSLYCQSAFATYQTVCLQMKLNNVHLICLNNAHSFFFFFFFHKRGRNVGTCTKMSSRFAALSALNAHMSALGRGTKVESSILMLQHTHEWRHGFRMNCSCHSNYVISMPSPSQSWLHSIHAH